MTDCPCSACTYRRAIAAYDLAVADRRTAVEAFRAGRASPAEFCEADKRWRAACEAFDRAYTAAELAGVVLSDQSVKSHNPYR